MTTRSDTTKPTERVTATLDALIDKPSMDWISTKSIADFYSEFFELFRFNVSPKLRHLWAAELKDKIKPEYWQRITEFVRNNCTDLFSVSPASLHQMQGAFQYEAKWKAEHPDDGEEDR